MNFLIRHLPELTFDVDIWVRDDAENLVRLNQSLRQLGAEVGADPATRWRHVQQTITWAAENTAAPPSPQSSPDAFGEGASAVANEAAVADPVSAVLE